MHAILSSFKVCAWASPKCRALLCKCFYGLSKVWRAFAVWHLQLSCMGRHPFSSLKRSKGCDEAVSILSSKTSLTRHWKNTSYTPPPSLSGVGVWVRRRWECVSCKAWIMQTLKQACSALPCALELSSLSSSVMVIITFYPVTIISCRYLCFPVARARMPSCVLHVPMLEYCVTAKLPCRTVKSITCMNQVIISNSWDSLVFGAQVCWLFESPQEGPSVVLINGLSTALQPECTCVHAGAHFQEKTPSLWNVAVFFCIKPCIFILWCPLRRRGSSLSANSRCFVSEVIGEYVDFKLLTIIAPSSEMSCPSELK